MIHTYCCGNYISSQVWICTYFTYSCTPQSLKIFFCGRAVILHALTGLFVRSITHLWTISLHSLQTVLVWQLLNFFCVYHNMKHISRQLRNFLGLWLQLEFPRLSIELNKLNAVLGQYSEKVPFQTLAWPESGHTVCCVLVFLLVEHLELTKYIM